MNCNICKRPLNRPNDPTTKDCGGNCLRCMAEVAQDPDCVYAMKTFDKELAERMVFVDEYVDKECAVTICKMGQGEFCCRYLCMGPKGWSCEQTTPLKKIIDYKVMTGQFTAQSINCGGRKPRS